MNKDEKRSICGVDKRKVESRSGQTEITVALILEASLLVSRMLIPSCTTNAHDNRTWAQDLHGGKLNNATEICP